jgi:hypothetical protein
MLALAPQLGVAINPLAVAPAAQWVCDKSSDGHFGSFVLHSLPPRYGD